MELRNRKPQPERAGRPLPHSPELERACLAACLLSPELVGRLGLGTEDFHQEIHREIWLGLDALHEGGEPVDLRTLQDELQRRGTFDRVGGLAHLAGLDQDLPSLEHAETYVRRLREYRRRRERIIAGESYLAALYDGGGIAKHEASLRHLLGEVDVDDQSMPTAIDVEAFLSLAFPPRQWLVEGLMQQKDAGMIHAWRGVGKTHFILSLTWALVSGGQFLKFRVPEPCGVLLIDGEMPREDLQRRLAGIVRASPSRRSAPLRILASDMVATGLPSLASVEGQAIVESNLAQFPEIKVVVVDNISTLCMSGQAENDAESWNVVQEFVLRLRRRGISVIFVHHSNKNLSQRGTSKREDILSWVLDLRRPADYQEQDGARFEMWFSKARAVYGEAAQPLDVKLIDTEGGGLDWSWRPAEQSERERALAMLDEGCTPKEVAEELGIHRATVFRWKRRAPSPQEASVPNGEVL